MENGIEDAHAHIADSTGVHGISDTANLVYTSDARLSDQRTPTDGSVVTAKIADGAITTAKILDGTIAIGDLAAAVQQLLIPTGSVVQFSGTSAPTGWAICAGGELAIASYGDLYAILGTTYGALTNGSGSSGTTHFRLPDLRGRVAVGAGTGSGLTARSLGSASGSETHLLTAAESGLPAHSHSAVYSFHQAADTATGTASGMFNPNISTANASYPVTVNNNDPASAASAHNNMQPFVVLNYIIKT